jgi:ABC-type transport system substrate-binding protein
MISRRSLLAAAAASPIAFRAMAQSGGAGKTLTYGQSTAPLTLDPSHGTFSGYPAGYEAALCLYDRILDFDAHMNIVPGIAESWTIAGDLLSATLKLRAGVKFHDGTACDADAVKFNLERLIDKQRTTTNRPLWDPLASAEATDARTVVIKLKAPFSQLPNSLAHGSAAVVSPAAVAKYGETGIARNPVGAGPFRLSKFSPGQELVVEAFADYWGGKPRTDQITFRYIGEASTRVSALRTGSVDVIDNVPVPLVGPLKSDPNTAVIAVPGLRPIGCVINLSRDKLKDARVRRALNLAVPVATIAEKVFQGFARAPDSPLAFNTQGYHSVLKLAHDPAEARLLLAQAGFGAANKLSLTFNVSVGLFPNDVSVGEVVANALQQAGVDVQINKVEGGAYWETLRQDQANLKWDIAMFGFNPSNASGLYHLNSLFKSNADDAAKPDVWNVGRYRNADVDALLKQANETADLEQQNALLGQAQEIIWKEAPYIWLQVNENITATRKTVKDVEVWPIVFTNMRRAAG